MQESAPPVSSSQQLSLIDGPHLVFDRSDPTSVINLVSDRLRKAMESVPVELYALTEGELREKCKPTSTDYALRVSFWREFEKVISLGRTKIVHAEVFGGICVESYFYKLLDDPQKVAWMCRPVQVYAKEIEAILHRGTERLWELVEMKITNKAGDIDVKRANLFLKVYAEVSNRSKGMAVKRVAKDVKTLKATVNLNQPRVMAVPETLEEIQQRMAELGQVAPSSAPVVEAELDDPAAGVDDGFTLCGGDE